MLTNEPYCKVLPKKLSLFKNKKIKAVSHFRSNMHPLGINKVQRWSFIFQKYSQVNIIDLTALTLLD